MRAFVFPGQGSQSVGMGKSLYESHPMAKDLFGKADKILGYSLTDLCFNGPDDQLKLTQHAQPALFTVSYLLYKILQEYGVQANYMAGHSLGEFSALSAAGVFDFETGLSLVSQRGQLMSQAGQTSPGTMAAVLGMPGEQVKSFCDQLSADGGVLVVANYNCPGQVVISGEVAMVQKAIAQLKEQKTKVIPLAVSGGFHSPLLNAANEQFITILDGIQFNDASVPVVSNVTAQPSQSGAVLKEAVKHQMVSSVQWESTIRYFASIGVHKYVESGSGTVLSGLIRKTDKEAVTMSQSEWVFSEQLLADLNS